MARIKLVMPTAYTFSTELEVRITDLNYGGHLGNDAVLGLAHEARMRFLKHHGYSELNLAGAGLIMADAAIVFKSEGFFADKIQVNLAPCELHKYGFDLYYQLLHLTNGKELAHIKTGMLCFDYATRKLMPLPEEVIARFETKQA